MVRGWTFLIAILMTTIVSIVAGQPSTSPADTAAPVAAPSDTATPADTAAPVESPGPATTVPATTRPAVVPSGPAVIIPIRGTIDNFTRDSLNRRLDEARALGAKTAIMVLDTPGGLVSAALDITRQLRSTDDLVVVAYVERQAYSAGTMIGLAADKLVMQTGSAMGDSAPIAMAPGGGVAPLGGAERAKAESPIQADFYASAIRNGYDPLLVGSLVTVGRVVHYVESPAGERRFVESEQYKTLVSEGWFPVPGVPDPVDREDTLLTVDDQLAAKIGLSRGSYPSVDRYAADKGLTVLATLEPTTTERFAAFLGSAIVRLILLTVFVQALYIALHTPGHGAAEAIALTAFGFLVGVPLLSGYAQWWEILAILIGLALVATELFVIPGFGVAGIAGLVLIFGGLLLTFVGVEPGRSPLSLPQLGVTWSAIQRGLIVILGGLTASMLLSIWLRKYLPTLPYLSKLILTTTAGDGGAGTLAMGESRSSFPARGAVGVAATDLRPGGSASFHDADAAVDRLVNVVCDSGFLARGAQVEVVDTKGSYVVVRRVAGSQA